jgi:hypothetical protein
VPLFSTNDDLRAPELNAAIGVIAHKDVDQSVVNSTVLVSDESIVWDLLRNGLYILTARLIYKTEDIPDIQFGWALPGGAAMAWSASGFSTGSVYQNFGNADPAGGPTSFGGSGDGSSRVARVMGSIATGDEDGELRLRWSQNVANAATTTVLAGTFGVVRRIS